MADTPTLREAAQQALEAIEPVMAYGRFGTRDVEQAELQKAHAVLHAALAEQAAEQAPTVHDVLRDPQRFGLIRDPANSTTAGQAGVPRTAEEIRWFINHNFSALRYGREDQQPCDDDLYSVTAHDLLSSLFEWFEPAPAAEQAEPVAVPAGYALVPVEPTEAMVKAGEAAHRNKERDMQSPTPTEFPWELGGPMGYAWAAMIAAAPPAPARQEPPADWSVFNTGAEVAGGLTYAEALEYLTPARLERGWSAVCVVNKDNITAAPAEGGANG